jgi:hypothetical protein
MKGVNNTLSGHKRKASKGMERTTGSKSELGVGRSRFKVELRKSSLESTYCPPQLRNLHFICSTPTMLVNLVLFAPHANR